MADLRLARLKRRTRRLLVKNLARTAMLTQRPEPLAVVYGAPDYEENSLVTALRLTEVYAGQTVLVCVDPAATRRYLEIAAATVGGDAAAVQLVQLDKWRVLRVVGRAELLFYTHGLFFSPRSLGRRLHVNLWHGTGPKHSLNHNFPSVFRADALSSASPVWGAETAASLGTVPRGRVSNVLPGNARSDLLVRSEPLRAALGWDAGSPVALWLPTYRRSDDVSIGTLTDGCSLGAGDVGRVAGAARRAGVRLVVKPHPFDAERYDALGLEVRTTADIWAAGGTLGQALASAAGVLSDYSSAWVDALAAGVPVGLFCPDLEAYDRDRGFNRPPMPEIAADLLLRTDAELDEFFTALGTGTFRRSAQLACFTALGLVSGPRSAAMLQAVRTLGQERHGYDFGLAADG